MQKRTNGWNENIPLYSGRSGSFVSEWLAAYFIQGYSWHVEQNLAGQWGVPYPLLFGQCYQRRTSHMDIYEIPHQCPCLPISYIYLTYFLQIEGRQSKGPDGECTCGAKKSLRTFFSPVYWSVLQGQLGLHVPLSVSVTRSVWTSCSSIGQCYKVSKDFLFLYWSVLQGQ